VTGIANIKIKQNKVVIFSVNLLNALLNLLTVAVEDYISLSLLQILVV